MIGLPPPRARLYWACQVGGFGLYVALTFFQASKMGMPMPRALLEPLAAASIGIATTHLLRRRVRAKRWLTLGFSQHPCTIKTTWQRGYDKCLLPIGSYQMNAS